MYIMFIGYGHYFASIEIRHYMPAGMASYGAKYFQGVQECFPKIFEKWST